MDPRDAPLRQGDLRWLFHALTDADERAAVRTVLEASDELIYRAGQVQGAATDATLHGVPLKRLYYQRLGPGPDYPRAVLIAEGGVDPINTTLLCTPRDPHDPDRVARVSHPGPPRHVDAWISLGCDSDPKTCPGHDVLTWTAPLAATPLGAARQLHDAASWLLDYAADSISKLREIDPLRGHPPIARRHD